MTFLNKTQFLLLLSLSLPISAQAMSWIEQDNKQVRSDVQLLSAAGIITMPINTFPLPWLGIIRDLKAVNSEALAPALASARLSLIHLYLEKETQPFTLKTSVASEPARFRSYGDLYREKAEISASGQYSDARFALKLQGNLVRSPEDGDSAHLDGSYARMRLGNWIVSAEAVDRWWGPGNDTGLIVAGNARPVPSLSISRHDHAGFETPWLSWIGPWNVTATFGQLEEEREIKDAKLFTMRAEMRPFSWLEFGMSRSAVMCGQDKPCDAEAFWNMFKGNTNVGINDVTENEANQNGGVDFKVSGMLWNTPMAVYTEMIGEDSKQSFPFFQAKSKLFGAELWLMPSDSAVKLFIELSDTFVECAGPGDTSVPNCMYEHGEYKTGYRYQGRVMGSTYDNDAKTLVLGSQGMLGEDEWSLKLAWLQLNTDGTDKPLPGGNSISYQQAEDNYRLSGDYRLPLLSGWLTVGGNAARILYKKGAKEGGDEYDFGAFGHYELRF